MTRNEKFILFKLGVKNIEDRNKDYFTNPVNDKRKLIDHCTIMEKNNGLALSIGNHNLLPKEIFREMGELFKQVYNS